MPDALTIAQTCARHADDIQAEDIVVLDLRGISSLADFFVICNGTSVPHLKAISRDVRQKTEDEIGEAPRSSEGEAASLWLVIDYVDVVVHVFHTEMRELYALEDLWSDAPRVSLDFIENAASSGEIAAR
ncbi:MAG: ribosome silencing factor [Verrucomicrobiota bacterium]